MPKPAIEHPGIELIDVHQDLVVAESNRQLGNTDLRFGDAHSVACNRDAMIAAMNLSPGFRSVVMVAANSDRFFDLDEDPIEFDPADYVDVPEVMLPLVPQRYDPASPPKTADIRTDGFMTREKNVALVVNPADCAPVVLYDPRSQTLSLAHVGRRGAIRDIAPQMVERMVSTNQVNAKDLIVYIGASIAAKSYILPNLGEELQTKAWEAHITEQDAGYGIDIPGYVMSRLLEMSGIQPENTTVSANDVGANRSYFSLTAHKQNPTQVPNGRNGFGVAISPLAA